MLEREKGKFPGWPVWSEDEINAVKNVVRSGKWWCGAPEDKAGENVWEFQKEFADFQEAKHCIAVANGTVAIEAVLLAMDIGLGDEVILSDYTFFASASAVVAVNAVPIFCDIRPDTFLMDVQKVESLITPRTKAIIAVHLAGNPVEMDTLCDIAKRHNIMVIEDCAHAHGSSYKSKRMGNWGNAGTFSFQASKVLNAGEGGAVICNDDLLAEKIYSISDCGRKKGEYFYSHFNYGSNFRMSEFIAAILREQLKKFQKQHIVRNKNALYLREKLNAIEGIRVMEPTPGCEELGYYIFPFIFEPSSFKNMTKLEFERELHRAGIPTDDCYPPLHTLECFRVNRLKKGIDYSSANWYREKLDDKSFPVVTDIYSRSIQLPHYVFLAETEQLDYIVQSIQKLKE